MGSDIAQDPTACRECGSPLSSRSMVPHALYCGVACKRRAKSRRRNACRGPYGLRVCEMCGVTYRATDKDQRACSRHCAWMLRWVEAGKPLSMPRLHGQHSDLMVCSCGQLMKARRGRLCCDTCAHDRALAGVWVAGVKVCSHCAVPIPVYKGSGNLCALCQGERERDVKRKRRAAKRGVDCEAVRRVVVLKRDCYRCHICKRKTNPSASPLSPRYPTLDHLIPLALGGAHSYANVACACRECNVRKNTGVPPNGDQLRLIG